MIGVSPPDSAETRRAAEQRPVTRAATECDIPAIKTIADREKHALGFVHRGSLTRAVARDELIVASIGTSVVGFCHFYRRRDGTTTIYHVAVVPERRGEGIGRALLIEVGRSAGERTAGIIRLKCPDDLPANDFYSWMGFCLVATDTGRKRPLNVWERSVDLFRPTALIPNE
ncbi:MAG: GNAT family N-acetyltransferase [Chloroflexota bacterium]